MEPARYTGVLESYVNGETDIVLDPAIDKKPHGFWRDWCNFESELKKIIKKLRHFPARAELQRIKESSLAAAFSIHGGVNEIRKKMGYEEIKFKKKEFESFDKVKETLEIIIEETGDFPSATQLRERGLGNMVEAMFSYHGGINSLRAKLGYDIVESGYSTEEGIRKGLEELWEKHPEQRGKIPPDNWMRKNGFTNLGAEIVRNHGGFKKVREKFSAPDHQRYRHIELEKWDVLIEELNKMFKEHPELNNEIPSTGWMTKNGYQPIYATVLEHHGGMRILRSRLGQKQKRVENGVSKKFSYIKQKFEEIFKEHPELNNEIPAIDWFSENEYGALVGAIFHYHGGMDSVRQKLGQERKQKPIGYWKDFANVRAELEKIIAETGNFPSSEELRKRGKLYVSLGQAMHVHHGGINAVRTRMGYKERIKPFGYWEENLESVLQKLIEQLGHFPTQEELKKVGGINRAINLKYGGLIQARKVYGFEEIVKPKGYWRVWENIEPILKKLIEELGHFPTQNELKENGYQSVSDALRKYHGGISCVREKMGFEQLKKPMRYWTLENTIEECKRLIEETGNIPTQDRLKELGLTSLTAAISKYGGMHELREKFGKKSPERRKRFWRDEKNAVDAYRQVEQELGKPPSDKDLQKNGYSGLSDAINKYFGGITRFRKRAGLEQIRLDHHWTLETILEKYKIIMSELGHNPTSTEIKEKDSALFNAIDTLGGIRKIRASLKLEDYTKPNGYWTKKRVLEKSRELYQELGHLPSQKELCKLGLSILSQYTVKYFGGKRQLRKLLGDKQIRVENGYWTEERVLDETKKIVAKLGYLPSNKQLCKLGYTPLASQIGKHKNGYRYFREKLGLDQSSRQAGYWQNRENVLAEAKKLYDELGYFPTQVKLGELGLGSICKGAIDCFGGLRNLRKIVESEDSSLERVLDAYIRVSVGNN